MSTLLALNFVLSGCSAQLTNAVILVALQSHKSEQDSLICFDRTGIS